MNPVLIWLFGVASGVVAVEIAEQVAGILVASIVASMMRGWVQ